MLLDHERAVLIVTDPDERGDRRVTRAREEGRLAHDRGPSRLLAANARREALAHDERAAVADEGDLEEAFAAIGYRAA